MPLLLDPALLVGAVVPHVIMSAQAGTCTSQLLEHPNAL